MSQIHVDPQRPNRSAPRPGGLVDNANHYLPRRLRINHSDGVVLATALVVLTLVLLLAFNLSSTQVWAFGFRPSVPLSLQWIISFGAGAVAALRLQHLRASKTRR